MKAETGSREEVDNKRTTSITTTRKRTNKQKAEMTNIRKEGTTDNEKKKNKNHQTGILDGTDASHKPLENTHYKI